MTMFEWAYDGVNSSIPRNVGPDCANYLSLTRRVIETAIISVFIISCIIYGHRRIKWPTELAYINQDRIGRRRLLILMSMVLGMEIGFKFNSRTIIYLLNPCHVTTALQLYLLAANPSSMVTAIFRIHLNLLNGPVLAYMFPETESRRIFADKALYYIQHGLMIVIPYYLLRIGGVYNIDRKREMSWSILSYGLNAGYHFWVLQTVAWPVQVNLSHMLCAAVLDPFEGQNYRIWAIIHQALLCPLLYKTFVCSCDYLLTRCPLTRVKSSLELPLQYKMYRHNKIKEPAENFNLSENGHTRCD